MKIPRTKWALTAIVGFLLFVLVVITALVAGSIVRKRFEPYIREKAVAYLSQRFDSDVTLSRLRIRIPTTSPLHMLFTGGRGTLARVEGFGLTLHQKQARNFPPLLTLRHFTFDVDLGAVFDSPATVNEVALEGMELTIPPKGERASLKAQDHSPSQSDSGSSAGVLIERVTAKNSRLVILPKTAGKTPLSFEIADLRLESAGKYQVMSYTAVLTNPKPPGMIHSKGSFGPWSAIDPGDTPLSGDYSFNHADLSVFSAIAGILDSTGNFSGTLSAINAKGQASVPDFRLKSADNPVPLSTEFEVLVDGENGNTILKPVRAVLGSTRFTTSGGIIRQGGDVKKTIALDVNMPSGNLHDVLRLAMKATPLMEGKLALKSKIVIPPLTGKVKEKLLLDGQFRISNGRFMKSGIQSKLDALSRRGQGKPKDEEINEVPSEMKGRFRMEDQTITFRSLDFQIPGAQVKLAGNYNLGNDTLDFHGSLGLQARVSQTMTGWKRWALKPADPFFAKNGVGTFLRIRIDGSSKSPNFGLDHGKPDPPKTEAGKGGDEASSKREKTFR
jgi:hypothetical protein